jgi:hypothetical protein
MPNGSPDFYERELQALEAFFAPIADVLSTFAESHNLILDRYYHESPSWRFNFRHPKGGIASIDVMKESDESIKTHLYWWVDDYYKFTRFSRVSSSKEIRIRDVNLVNILEEELKRVLAWEAGEWTNVTTGYEKIWSPMGREWLEKDAERYPEPKV